MNIQVNTVPRVTEVLPGYPAEAAGIRRGFVLIEVADRPVSSDTWFKEYQSQKLPFALTFDTQVPLQPGNPYFSDESSAAVALQSVPLLNFSGQAAAQAPVVQE